jgi:general secretion pathway protein I
MRRGSRAFTLLEVMIAVLILGVSLASLFSAQTNAVGATQYIKHVAMATQLARCRMSEIEIEILKEGFEVAEFEDWERGPCCELRDDRVRLPGEDPFECRWRFETVTLPSVADAQTAAGEAAMEGNTEAATGAMSMGMLGPLLPVVQQLLENAIRKVSVEVVWRNGERERSVELVQFLTNPSQGTLGGMLRSTEVEERSEELQP